MEPDGADRGEFTVGLWPFTADEAARGVDAAFCGVITRAVDWRSAARRRRIHQIPPGHGMGDGVPFHGAQAME